MIREDTSKFIFSGHQWSAEDKKATFHYELHHDKERFTFIEILAFPQSLEMSKVPQELLKTILDNLLLVLGISYYKLYCPKQIIIEGFELTKSQAGFWDTVYTKGLGEFFYKNQIDFRELIAFPFSPTTKSKPISFLREDRSLVGIGGGKDSIVTAELLKKDKKPFSCFVVNTHTIREEVIGLIGCSSIFIKRLFDPKLFELNNRQDAYNGHVPVSSQYAFIGLLCAVLYDYRFVIVSNEQSSNYGSVHYLGMEVNHQWSKSFEFETMFQEYVKRFITPDVIYFSLLRPLTEISVVKRFVQYPQYFSSFSSCNRNFRIDGKGSDKKWCGECAKCAFAFIMLAAFLPKEQVVSIFGQDLFEKESLLPIYKELLGVAKIKPFDCVGTPDEVRAAFSLALKHGYIDEPVIKFFEQEVLLNIVNSRQLQERVFIVSKEHRIQEQFQEIIAA